MIHYLIGAAAAAAGILVSYGGVPEALLAFGAVLGIGVWAIAHLEGLGLRTRHAARPDPL
jgi:hypothetical protein